MQFSTLSLTAALAVLTAAAPQLAVRQPPIPIGEVELWSSAGCNPPGAPQLSTLPLFFESCVQFSPAPTSLEVTTLETTCIVTFYQTTDCTSGGSNAALSIPFGSVPSGCEQLSSAIQSYSVVCGDI